MPTVDDIRRRLSAGELGYSTEERTVSGYRRKPPAGDILPGNLESVLVVSVVDSDTSRWEARGVLIVPRTGNTS